MHHVQPSDQPTRDIYRQAFELAVDGMVVTDADGVILRVNPAFTRITGYTEAETRGQTPRLLKSGLHAPEFYAAMWNAMHEHGAWSGEIWNRKKDGTMYQEWLHVRAMRNDAGAVTGYLGYFRDITELKDQERQILFMAYHDALTGLPNRGLLDDRLAKAISQARRNARKLALFFIDLDDFKRINDSLGHDKGDELLLEVTRRLSGAIRTEDTLCRQGGDEFILLAENISDESAIHHLVDRILDMLRPTMEIGAKRLQVNASIGIAVFPEDGDTPAELTKSADMAMYRAKALGKNKYVMFQADMNRAMRHRQQLEADIRDGLARGEFFLQYQPRVRCQGRTVVALEALLRWKRGQNYIAPADFIPVAEECGLIEELGWLGIEQACVFHHRLLAAGMCLPISVNLSLRQFHQPNLVGSLDRILLRNGVDPVHLEFEITESTSMARAGETLAAMDRLRQRGFRFAIDDFGTGCSCLHTLHRLPVSTLKIDGRFVAEMIHNASPLAATIVGMGHHLGLTVVAEAVETQEQLRYLQDMGCDEMQGHLICPPLADDEMLDFLLRHTSLS